MCDEFVHRVRVCVCVRESRYAIELIFCVELCVVQRSVCCELCEIDAQIPNNNNKNWSYCRSLCMHEHNSTGWLFSASVTDNLTCSRWHDSHFKCNCSTSLYWTSIQMVCLVLCNGSVYIWLFFFFSLLHSVSVCDCNESVRFHAPRCIRNGKPNGARRLNERVLDVGVVGNRNHNAFTWLEYSVWIVIFMRWKRIVFNEIFNTNAAKP